MFKSRTTRFGDQRSTADSPSRRSCSPPPEISIIHHSPSLAHSSSLPPIPVMVGSELAEQSSGGVESWNSLAFDKVGDVEVTNANININANYHRPRTAPDLIITQLRPNSPDIQDPFHRPPSPSTFNERSLSRSAEITRSHTPGYTFGSRSPIKEYSLASSSLETGNQVHLFAQVKSIPESINL